MVEASPYYWWWYALTLNAKRGEQSTIDGDILRDFGDVKFSDNRYLAFCNWWREPVNTFETRAEFLFAEPETEQSVALADNDKTASETFSDPQSLLLLIPLNKPRRHIEKHLNLVLNSIFRPEHGPLSQSVKHSRARYSLSSPVLATSLKKCFDLYDKKQLALKNGEVISNFDLAKRANVHVVERKKEDRTNFASTYHRSVSATVSRYIKKAENMIDKAGRGQFP
jgi:hypothetical protein